MASAFQVRFQVKEFVKDTSRQRLKYDPMDKVYRAIMYVRILSYWFANICVRRCSTIMFIIPQK